MAKKRAKTTSKKTSTLNDKARQASAWLESVENLVSQGQTTEAKDCLTEQKIQEIISQFEDSQERYQAYYQIATMLYRIGLLEETLPYCTKALEFAQGVDAYNLRGLTYLNLRLYQKAIDDFNKANELDPLNRHVCNNLAMALMKTGENRQAIQLFKDIIQKYPDFIQAHSNLLLNLNYLPETTCDEMFHEAKQWAENYAPTSLMIRQHRNLLDPLKKLRIGYISPDFKRHPVMYFFDSLLTAHDRSQFELFGYGNVTKPDETTESVIERFNQYHNILGMPDDQVASLIQSEQIDILVDLAGHTKHTRISVLAYKPAPIQVTYLGYPNTTGMEQVDYRFTDTIADPREHQQYYSEKLVYLPNGFLSYNPGDEQPTVTATPALTNGYITFGCFNNICKVNMPLLKQWVEILNATPNSKLLMKFGEAIDEEVRKIYLQKFIDLGLENAEKRVVFSGFLPSPQHLELYNSVDIALDTYPYNGTTTTFQALLMGTPVITLAGDCHASRVGLDILTRLNLQFFAAQTPEEYVKKAVALAMKPDAISQIRTNMRQRLAASPCCNTKTITKDIERTYRAMWEKYCQDKILEKWKHRSTLTLSETKSSNSDKNGQTRGVFYVVWGNTQQAEEVMQKSITSLKQHHPELPIHIERFESGGKINKTKICDLSPFDVTAYLDNDTVILGSLDFAFEKAAQFGLACCHNENPWARRYCDDRLCGDMLEYNAGVLFFSKKAKPLFDTWRQLFENIDGSIFHLAKDKLSYMPVANQGSLALAIHESGFNPFVLSHNWNFRPSYHAHFFGPIKIWHGYEDVPQIVLDWNDEQSTESAVIAGILNPNDLPTQLSKLQKCVQ